MVSVEIPLGQRIVARLVITQCQLYQSLCGDPMHDRIPGIREATKGIKDGDIEGVHVVNENRGMGTHY